MKKLLSSPILYLVLWLILHGGALLAVITNWEPTPVYLAVSLVYGALLALTTGALWLLIRDGARLWRQLSTRWVFRPGWLWPLVALILLMWLWPAEPAYPFHALRWLITSAAGLSAAFLLRRDFSPLAWRWGVLAFIAAVLILSILTISGYPKLYTDEGWNTNKAWSSAQDGLIYSVRINLGVHGRPQLVNTELIWWVMGGWFRVAGLGLFQGRLLAWFGWLFMVALIFVAVRRLYDKPTAVIAALFVGSSVLALITSHYVRPEMYINTAMALALLIWTAVEKRKRFREAFLLGLVLSLSLDIHANAFIYCFAFGAYYLGCAAWASLQAKRVIIDRRLLGIAAGGLAGAAVYVGLHVLPNPAAYMEQASYYYGVNYGTSKFSAPMPLDRVLVILNHFRVWYAASIPEGSMVIGSVIGLLLLARHNTRDRTLVSLFVLCVIGWLLLGSYPSLTYVANLLPIGAVLVGVLITRLAVTVSHVHRSHAVVLGAVLLAAVFGNAANKAITVQNAGSNRQYSVCAAELRKRLPAEGMILGEPLFWLVRDQLTDYASRVLVDTPWQGRDSIGWLQWIDPDIILWNGPVPDPVAQYAIKQHYALHEMPACEPFLTIWLRAGVALSPP